LIEIGYEPVFDDRVFQQQMYLAGSIETRAASLIDAWSDRSIAGIISVRGGYGSAQLLPLIDPKLIRANEKLFIGCSDLTSWLTFLTIGCGLVGIHGPMLINLADKGYDRRSLLSAVSTPHAMGSLVPEGLEVISHGEARGPLLGGTLTQLVASLSTPYAFTPTTDYVLLLDDVEELPYRLDRMLTQLLQAGVLRRAVAVVCAEFPGCRDHHGRDARIVVEERLSGFSGPILFGFPTGHTAGALWTLPLGLTVSVRTTPRPGLTVEESAVR
jgi:muramoyltetrapeptide carboxypeptidase